MMNYKQHDRAIEHLRKGADLLRKSKETVHLPDSNIVISNGAATLRDLKCERGQDITECKLAELIRYLADMMGD